MSDLIETLPPPPPKACSCGATYDYFDWAQLPLVGTMDDGAGGAILMRNCVCGSTLAVES